MTKKPFTIAAEISELIRNDHIAASYIHKIIPPSELLDLLGLRLALSDAIEEQIEDALRESNERIESLLAENARLSKGVS
jgi:hypothetical protein